MTVVDVNTGKFTGSGGNLEQTVTRNNLEAAEETVRQLRLRDIGGIVVIDFIDMVLESNRDLVLRRLTEALARDRTRHQVSEVTSLGLVQLTRKKLGTGLIEAFSTTCTHCAGRGIMLHGDPVDSASATGRKSEARRCGGVSAQAGGEADEGAVAKVPAHLPASTRCSRRWPRPTASMRATTTTNTRATNTTEENFEGQRPSRKSPSSIPNDPRGRDPETADEDLDDDYEDDDADDDESDADE